MFGVKNGRMDILNTSCTCGGVVSVSGRQACPEVLGSPVCIASNTPRWTAGPYQTGWVQCCPQPLIHTLAMQRMDAHPRPHIQHAQTHSPIAAHLAEQRGHKERLLRSFRSQCKCEHEHVVVVPPHKVAPCAERRSEG